MKRNELISYAAGFASFLLSSEIADRIERIILFGSVASGSFDEESDIDIFVDSREDIKKEVGKVVKAFRESDFCRRWRLKGIKNELSVKTGDLSKWGSLKRSVTSSGIVLYGRYMGVPEELGYYVLVKTDFRGMKRNEKIGIWRKLYGYTQTVGGKKYSHEGIVKKLGGRKITDGVVLIPGGKKSEFLKLLNANRIKYEIYEIWSDSFGS